MNEPQNISRGSDIVAWITVTVIIGILAWLTIPPWLEAHTIHNSNPCINNLRQFDGAKNGWALEKGKTNGTVCTAKDIKPYVQLDAEGQLPRCPGGGRYIMGRVGQPPICTLGKSDPGHKLPE